MSQCDKIVAYMKEHDGITQKEAVNAFGCYRLAARIHDLREDGYIIDSVREENNGYFGHHARYFLVKDPNEVHEPVDLKKMPVNNTTSARDFMSKLRAMLKR